MNSTELLKLAVSDLEDFAANDPSYACHFCKYNYGDEYCPESKPCFVWEHADRVRELTTDSTSNEELFKLLAQIRNYYSATPGWNLFEEDVDRLIGRQKPHEAAKVIPEFKPERKRSICEGYCPVCGTPFFKGERRHELCTQCGQKLDWSDVNGVE